MAKRLTKAQREAQAALQQNEQALQGPAPEQAMQSAAAAFFASRQIANEAQAESSEEISDADIAAQQAEAESAYDKAIEAAMAEAQAAAPAKGSKKPYIKQSSIVKPTKAAWAIYDTMRKNAEENNLPYPSRGECIAEAIRRGIASGTSATQYQYWKKHYGY